MRAVRRLCRILRRLPRQRRGAHGGEQKRRADSKQTRWDDAERAEREPRDRAASKINNFRKLQMTRGVTTDAWTALNS